MRKNSIYLFFVVFLLASVSCRDELQVETTDINVDFGKGIYKEPFKGIFKSHPLFLVSTLDWPIFKGLKADTLELKKTLEFSFNQESVRSQSIVMLHFVDTLYNELTQIEVFCNNEKVNHDGYPIRAALNPQYVEVTYRVNPSLGDSIMLGYITMNGLDLDVINDVYLNSDEPEKMAYWTCNQEIKGHWLVWILWLLLLLIATALVAALIYLLYKVIPVIISAIGNFFKKFSSSTSTPTNTPTIQPTSTPQKDRNKDMKENKGKECPCDNCMWKYCNVLISTETSLPDKCQTLYKLSDYWETLDSHRKEELYDKLCPQIKKLLERYWEIPQPTPNKHGCWKSGIKGSGIFYFDDNYVPAANNTRNGMCWSTLVDAYKKDFNLNVDGGIRYHNNRIDLRPYAIATIEIPFDSPEVNLEKLRQRGGANDTIQVVGASMFDQKLKNRYKAECYNDFWEFKDGLHNGKFTRDTPLVIHEDYDGKTLMLVPKYLHDNWKHYGGIALACAIKEAIKEDKMYEDMHF